MKNSFNTRYAFAISIGALATVTLSSSACSRAAEQSASDRIPSGEVRLEFVGPSQSRLQFKLSNHSTQRVSFRGTYRPSEGATPWDTQFECKALDSEFWELESFALIDGELASVDISPGETRLLLVDGEFTTRYKGSLCHVKLRMGDFTFIQSNDFRP